MTVRVGAPDHRADAAGAFRHRPLGPAHPRLGPHPAPAQRAPAVAAAPGRAADLDDSLITAAGLPAPDGPPASVLYSPGVPVVFGAPGRVPRLSRALAQTFAGIRRCSSASSVCRAGRHQPHVDQEGVLAAPVPHPRPAARPGHHGDRVQARRCHDELGEGAAVAQGDRRDRRPGQADRLAAGGGEFQGVHGGAQPAEPVPGGQQDHGGAHRGHEQQALRDRHDVAGRGVDAEGQQDQHVEAAADRPGDRDDPEHRHEDHGARLEEESPRRRPARSPAEDGPSPHYAPFRHLFAGRWPIMGP